MRYKLGPGPWCGTTGGYTNHRCRCEACTAANRARMNAYYATHPEQVGKKQAREAARRLRLGMTPRSARVVDERCPIGFGSRYGYNRRGCRCPYCREAQTRYAREQRAKARGRGGPPAVPATPPASSPSPRGGTHPRSVEPAGFPPSQLPTGGIRQSGAS